MPQSFTCLHYHVVFSTKNREAQISATLMPELCAYIGGIIANHDGVLLAAGGMSDHVHLLCSLHQNTSVADVARLVKTNSSKWVHEEKAPAEFAWQSGYGAFSVSHSGLDAVRKYIAGQEEHHRKMTFQEEFVLFLKRHEIEYDERYIWE